MYLFKHYQNWVTDCFESEGKKFWNLFKILFSSTYPLNFFFFWLNQQNKSLTCHSISSLSVCMAKSPICPSAGLMSVWSVKIGALNWWSKVSKQESPLSHKSLGPHVLQGEDKDVIMQKGQRQSPPHCCSTNRDVPLGCISGIFCLPSGWRGGQRSGRQRAPERWESLFQMWLWNVSFTTKRVNSCSPVDRLITMTVQFS